MLDKTAHNSFPPFTWVRPLISFHSNGCNYCEKYKGAFYVRSKKTLFQLIIDAYASGNWHTRPDPRIPGNFSDMPDRQGF